VRQDLRVVRSEAARVHTTGEHRRSQKSHALLGHAGIAFDAMFLVLGRASTQAQREEIGLRAARAKHSAWERDVYCAAAPAGYSKDEGRLRRRKTPT
jgi:hypothetical protein